MVHVNYSHSLKNYKETLFPFLKSVLGLNILIYFYPHKEIYRAVKKRVARDMESRQVYIFRFSGCSSKSNRFEKRGAKF